MGGKVEPRRTIKPKARSQAEGGILWEKCGAAVRVSAESDPEKVPEITHGDG